MIDKFFETGFKKTSPYPNWWESALYKLFNKADYSLLKYSVEHVNILIQDFDQWLLEFSNEKHNK